MYVCSLRYPACKAHAPYYVVICGQSGCTIFCNNITQSTRFSEKQKVFLKKCISVNILKSFSKKNISLSTKKSGSYYHKCISVFIWSTSHILPILMKPEFSGQIFERVRIWSYTKILTEGAELLHTDGGTDT
jgi:hypothetical protein